VQFLNDSYAASDSFSGFVVKIKKLLETVCHNCGIILADYVSLPW
jgi:hypothetical protein